MIVSPPRACIMGYPVSQSRSPILHGYWLRTLHIAGIYDHAEISPQDFPEFFQSLAVNNYVGGNITKPHKEAAFRLVDRRDATAEAIGAVNTVWFENGKLIGGNTDVSGFLAHLDDCVPGWEASDRPALVLGAGGAARAVVYGLISRGLDVVLFNRTLTRAEQLAANFGRKVKADDQSQLPRYLPSAGLLVNTSSLGALGQLPLDIDLAPLPREATVYDINYMPLETQLLKTARARGNRTVDGLGMLMHQAVPAFAQWFGVVPKVTRELRTLLEDDIRTKPGGA